MEEESYEVAQCFWRIWAAFQKAFFEIQYQVRGQRSEVREASIKLQDSSYYLEAYLNLPSKYGNLRYFFLIIWWLRPIFFKKFPLYIWQGPFFFPPRQVVKTCHQEKYTTCMELSAKSEAESKLKNKVQTLEPPPHKCSKCVLFSFPVFDITSLLSGDHHSPKGARATAQSQALSIFINIFLYFWLSICLVPRSHNLPNCFNFLQNWCIFSQRMQLLIAIW